MAPGLAESRLLGASGAWGQERELAVTGGLMPAPGAGREPRPAKLWARAPESACTWLLVVLGQGRGGECVGAEFQSGPAPGSTRSLQGASTWPGGPLTSWAGSPGAVSWQAPPGMT